jgi:cytidine deaminase
MPGVGGRGARGNSDALEAKPRRIIGENEVHIVLVRPLGTDVRPLCEHLESVFAVFGYQTTVIKMSSFIDRLDPSLPGSPGSYHYYKARMKAGNDLRDNYGGGILALFSVNEVRRHRLELLEAGHDRLLFIHDSAMHSDEVLMFRQCYDRLVFVISINRSEAKRRARLMERLRNAGTSNEDKIKEYASELIAQDLGRRRDGNKRRLSFEETFVHADVFLDGSTKYYHLDSDSRESRHPIVRRFVRQLFSYPHGVPTWPESMMAHAFTAATASGCVSRTVGAAIATETGELLSLGRNDVPKAGGGLYLGDEHGGAGDAQHTFSSSDFRILDQTVHGADSNDLVKLEMLQELFENAATDRIVSLAAPESLLERLLGSNRVRQSRFFEVIAYGRTVHAEMDAITTAARRGLELGGSTLYTTTFPCHECARHIVAAGIKKVIFVQPYPKSRVGQLHSDSVELIDDPDTEPTADKVTFMPFSGIAPRSVGTLYSFEARKTDDPGQIGSYGRVVKWEPGGTWTLRGSIAGTTMAAPLRGKAIQAAEELAAAAVSKAEEVAAKSAVLKDQPA